MNGEPSLSLPDIPLWRASDLHRDGMDSRKIARLVASGKLVRVRRGGYVAAASWNVLSPARQELLRILVHHHTSLPSASGMLTYSHTTAARLHGLSLWRADSLIHLTQRFKASRGGNAVDVVPHTAELPEGAITRRYGLPVTTLEQTAVDCSRTLPFVPALIIAEHALSKGANRTAMLSIVETLAGHKNVANARDVLKNASSLSESPDETRTLDFVRRMHLPLPAQQERVLTRNGEHRLDFAWREWKLALEFDGKIKYFDYRPTDEAVFQERRREKVLMEEGWTVLRIEWSDLANEPELKRRIVRALHRAQHRTRGSVA